MTAHTHTELVDGCYRCELNRDEMEILRASSIDYIVKHLSEASGEKLDIIEAVLDL